MKPPARSEAGYRRYSDTTVEELGFIKKAQTLGFSLDEIAEILKISRAGRRPWSHVLDLARRHLAAVDERIQQLQRLSIPSTQGRCTERRGVSPRRLLPSTLGFRGTLAAMGAGVGIVLVLTALPASIGQAKSIPSLKGVLSNSPGINRLSLARMALFASRDVWFVVSVPSSWLACSAGLSHK